MTAREQAEELRQQAITTLLDEKVAIDALLDTLGYQKETASQKVRRGRPKKAEVILSETVEQQIEQPLSRS